MDRQWFTASWIPLLFLLFLFQESIIDGFAKGDLSFEYENCSRQNRACLDPEYHITIAFGEKSGNLTLEPENIHAVDLDSLNSSIQYTFLNGTPEDYSDYFEIDSKSGTVKQIKTVSTTNSKRFVITVEAEEEESNRRSTTAQLRIYVKHKICSSASDEQYGYVVENSTAGTKILDKRGQPIMLTVLDNNSCQKNPKVSYTFEVLNNFFTVDSDGYVCVNNTILVSDSPSTRNYTFQINVIKRNGQGVHSLPYKMTIYINGIKNNPSQMTKLPPSIIEDENDEDDQDLSFDYKNCIRKNQNGACLYPKYHTTIAFNEKSGNLTLEPENIHAVDLDSLNSSIQYTFSYGTPTYYSKFFNIDPKFGTVEQIETVCSTTKFNITVKAKVEESNRRSTTAQLYIDVKQKIFSSASGEQYGYVDENSTAGTKILDKRGHPIVLTISKNDSCQNDPTVSYTFEVLDNIFFKVNPDGYVCVNNTILVSNSPSTRNYTFQIKLIGKDAYYFDSLPYQMTIFLNDNNVTEINKEQYSTTSYSTIAVSKKGDSKLELDRTTELIKTTVQVTAEDHVSDNKIQTITSSSASVQANGNNGDSLFNNIYFLIALLVLVLIIAVIVSIVVSYLRCKASKETKENKYQMPYNVTMYTKPCDYVEQLLYTDVNNEYNDSLDYAGYMVLENIDKSGDIHSPVNTMTKTASVNRIGSKATSTDDRSKMAVASKPVVYDYATVGEKEFKQSAAHDGMTTFQRKDVKFCTNSKQ